jgi:LAS superfamily LD-carboxypeptidase LdcB
MTTGAASPRLPPAVASSWGATFDVRRNGWGHALARALVALAVGAVLLAPGQTGAQEPSAEEQREAVRQQGAAVAAEIDVLNAQDAEIQAALTAVQAQVAGQQVVVNQASDAQVEADAAVAASVEQITALETETAALNAAIDQMIVDAFVHPPLDHALDAFKADTIADATVRNGLVDIKADEDAATLDRLAQAEEELSAQKAEQEVLAGEAAQARSEADAALAELDAALATQTQLATEVEARLNAKLAEADALRASDAALSQQIAAEQAALAAALAASQAQPSGSPSSIQPAPGGLATVTCPAGGSITVAGAIASNLQSLLDDAFAAGLSLCGGGYRDPAEQIALREAHCGTSNYAIYEMPASQCDPPTARPGTSMHEQGLAIDFTCNGGGALSRSSVCFGWLSRNAADYGFFNLPEEPWHWSTNGN